MRELCASCEPCVGIGEKDGFLGEPFEDGVVQGDGLQLMRYPGVASVELCRCGRGDEGVAAVVGFGVYFEYVAADYTAGWVDEVDVADVSLRIEGTLHDQRTSMRPMRQDSAS